LVDGRKQAKLRLLQDPNLMNEENLSNVMGEASNVLGTRKGDSLKTKLMTLNQAVRARTSETSIGDK
jgi:hypothetical protein